jgi:hypothetical protein
MRYIFVVNFVPALWEKKLIKHKKKIETQVRERDAERDVERERERCKEREMQKER